MLRTFPFTYAPIKGKDGNHLQLCPAGAIAGSTHEAACAYTDHKYSTFVNQNINEDGVPLLMHFPVLKGHIHNTLCALKVVVARTEEDVDDILCRLAAGQRVFANMITPIKQLQVFSCWYGNDAFFFIEITTQWCDKLTVDVGAPRTLDFFYSMCKLAIESGLTMNDLSPGNTGMMGGKLVGFDFDNEFVPFKTSNCCLPSYWLFVLLMCRLDTHATMPHPASLTVDQAAKYLNHIPSSPSTQVFIFAGIVFTATREHVMCDEAAQADALMVEMIDVLEVYKKAPAPHLLLLSLLHSAAIYALSESMDLLDAIQRLRAQ